MEHDDMRPATDILDLLPFWESWARDDFRRELTDALERENSDPGAYPIDPDTFDDMSDSDLDSIMLDYLQDGTVQWENETHNSGCFRGLVDAAEAYVKAHVEHIVAAYDDLARNHNHCPGQLTL